MSNFAEITEEMKKALLLLAASLMFLAGCQKDATRQEENSLFSVTKEYTCECGAKYSVTCKNPTGINDPSGNLSDWNIKYSPTSMWAVKNAAGENVPFEEYRTTHKIRFKCQNQECNKEKTFHIDEFKPQTPSLR